MLNLEERRWVLSMLHTCPNYEYITTESGRDLLTLALQTHIQYLIDRQTNIGLTDPIPQTATGNWVRQIFRTCPVPIISGALHQSIIDYAMSIIQSPLLKVLDHPDTLTSLLGLLRTKDAVALTLVHPNVNRAVRQQYDPFHGRRGRVMFGNVVRTHIPLDLGRLLTTLARHAFNHIFDLVPNPGVDHARTEDKQLTTLSDSSKFGSSGNSFLATNCVAQSQVSGLLVTTVNFISYGPAERSKLVNKLKLDTRDYDRITHLHAEIRIVEKQDDAAEHSPINVDKLCCPFCTVQLLAMGRLALTRGSARTKKLQWYTFTPYVVYFRYRRMLIWGAGVEAIFDGFQPDTKSLFLQVLAGVCRNTRYSSQELEFSLNVLREILSAK